MDLSDLELGLPCDDRAPSAVRQALSDGADQSWAMGDAMLVASELVTNAVRHSGCGEHDQIQVSVKLRDEHLVIDVRDPGLSNRDAEVRAGAELGGFGLQIVDQLAVRWGSEREFGYRVWAEVPLPTGPLDR
jgi:anti-sigma regulatory factor (Ser/Thr protein kinase)